MTNRRTLPGWNQPTALGLAILVIASYATVLTSAGWIWDDAEYVTRNPVLNGAIENGLWAIWTDTTATPQYYPVVHTSFWLEWRIFPSVLLDEGGVTLRVPHPTGFHLTNVLLMVATVLLFWRILLRLEVPGAVLAAALFAVHPVHVESVAWVTERKNMLSALFALACVSFYLRFAGVGASTQEQSSRRAYVGALVCFVLGLLSKTVIAFLPPALFLLVWWRRPEHCKRHLLPLLPLLALGVLAGLHTAQIEAEQVSAGTAYFDLSLLQRLLLAGSVVWTYLLHILLPLEQIFFYPKWQPDAASAVQWIALVGVVVVLALAVRSTRVFGRGPLVAILIFGGALVPVMGFLDVYPFRFSWVADHFQYHANFSMFGLLGAALTRVPLPARGKRFSAAILVAGLAILTSRQGLVYRDQETLWRDTIAKNPDAWVAYQNLGEVLRIAGQTQEARRLYEEGHKRHPDANFLASLALLEFGLYEDSKAARHLDSSIQLGEQALRMRPRFPPARALLAQAYGEKGAAMHGQVIEQLERMIANVSSERMLTGLIEQKFLDPVLADAMRQLFATYSELGQSRLAAGDASGAFDLFRKSNRAIRPPGTSKWRDLYPWRPGTPWFPLEVQRLWMLAASGDAAIRDPQRAQRQLAQLNAQFRQQMDRAGIPPNQRTTRRAQLMDLQAAILAALGDFQAAVGIADQLLAGVRGRGAPADWVRGIEARRAGYAARKPYVVGKRMPFAGGR